MVGAGLAAGSLGAATQADALPGVYLDTTDITLPTSGPADRYPADIAVAQLPKGIASVSVGIHGFDHPSPDDVDVMLASPNGQSVLLMSDVTAAASPSPVSLTFASSAAGEIPATGPLSSGTYLPTNIGTTDPFPFPASSQTLWFNSLDVFKGGDPNGTWRLYVVDDDGSSPGGVIDAWTLVITTVDPPATPVITSPANGLDTDGAFALGGTGAPGSAVDVYENSVRVAATYVQGDGTWSATLEDQAPGLHSYVATARDAYGNVSAPSAVKTVGVDVVHPSVLHTRPAAGADGVRRGRTVQAFTSEPVRPRSITGTSVRLVRVSTGSTVKARLRYDVGSAKVVIDPRRDLAAHARYRVVIGTGVKDLAGNRLDQRAARPGNQAKVWRFTTR